MRQIGARIKAEREKRGMSQEALAAKAGVGGSTISYIEQGTTKNPTRATLRAIADALNIPHSALGVADEKDTPSLRPEVQHLLHLLMQLPEDRAEWYIDAITRDIETDRQKRQIKIERH